MSLYRTASYELSLLISHDKDYTTIFVSSVLNLCELLGLRPDLLKCKKYLYFHENQLAYPTQKKQERDVQFGLNQILSCLVADSILFNSQYNLSSFYEMIPTFLNSFPYKIEVNIKSLIEKSIVLYYPIEKPIFPTSNPYCSIEKPINIIWPHRWEHDKNPESFFNVLYKLDEKNIQFTLTVIGEKYEDSPEIFSEAKMKLSKHIKHWGFVETKEEYWKLLFESNVAVSTANHEFYGVSMLECCLAGCFILCPNRLSYPFIFSKDHLYTTDTQLYKKLKDICVRPTEILKDYKKCGSYKSFKQQTVEPVSNYQWEYLKTKYNSFLSN